MVVLCGLLAATAYALGTVLQQKGTLQTGDDVSGARFLLQLFRLPVRLLGGLATGLGWILQAVALHLGWLFVVQSLVTLSLVISLPLGAWLTDQRITGPVWVAACALVAGIVVVAAGAHAAVLYDRS